MATAPRHLRSSDRLLAELARLYGVQIAYRDFEGTRRRPPAESVTKVLGALGAHLPGDRQGLRVSPTVLRSAIQARKLEYWGRVLEPVLVAWDGVLPEVVVRAASGTGGREGQASFTLWIEGGGTQRFEAPLASTNVIEEATVAGTRFRAYVVFKRTSTNGMNPKIEALPSGYHRLLVEGPGFEAESLVVSAPVRAWVPSTDASCTAKTLPMKSGRGSSGRPWGIFAPLYALRSDRDWGAGDLTDLEQLARWVGEVGGDVIATLPILAAFLDRPFEPTPYRPVSRLFWSEFYLDPAATREWEQSPRARAVATSGSTRAQIETLRTSSLVDYRAVMLLKRQVLEELVRDLFDSTGAERLAALEAFRQRFPEVDRYARFRAMADSAGTDWSERPPDEIRGSGELAAHLTSFYRYHLYCQWQTEEQIGRLSGHAGHGHEASGLPKLVLDLPLGVHPGGFDAWRWPELFVPKMSSGAPPDAFFAGGQSWDLPPLHPDRIRENGHSYFAHCLRHQMRHAFYLRIDHVMSLHRLFWIPEGTDPADGAYVGYPAEELYAIACVESHRNQCAVIGEDLGTVPGGVRRAMARHGVMRTWVLQASLRDGNRRRGSTDRRLPTREGRSAGVVNPVPRHSVAVLNTHDMFPFAGFARGDDIDARVATGVLPSVERRRQKAERHLLMCSLVGLLREKGLLSPGPAAGPPTLGSLPPTGDVLLALLRLLARSPATLVLVNLEDLLLETRPQNLPGTGPEWENWRRRMAASLTSIAATADWLKEAGLHQPCPGPKP